jgi:hypothetical protein
MGAGQHQTDAGERLQVAGFFGMNAPRTFGHSPDDSGIFTE